MSYYSSFYNTLNALEAENQVKRTNIEHEKSSPYMTYFLDAKHPRATEFQLESSLRRSYYENEKVQSENAASRNRVNHQLSISELKTQEVQKNKRICAELQSELVEQKYREINDVIRFYGSESPIRTRSNHLEELSNSRRKVYLNPESK